MQNLHNFTELGLKSTYDESKDVLNIRFSDKTAVQQKEPPPENKFVKLVYAADKTLVQIEFEGAKKLGLGAVPINRRVKMSEGWNVFLSLWNEYMWVTRGATLFLIVISFLSITKELDCLTKPICIPLAWLTALTSDGMLSLWTLIIALCVGIQLKIRQERGLLDGTDHYNIGRALAYGYFSNFLIGALLVIKEKSEKRDEEKSQKREPPCDVKLKLRVIFPKTLQELDQFRKTLEQELLGKTKNQSIDLVNGAATQTLRRNVLVLTTAASATPAAQDFYLDFPTTLYTVQDYFKTWNTYLEKKGRPIIEEAELARLQEKHISEFFGHLEELSKSDVGVKAVEKLGVNLDMKALSKLYSDHFQKMKTTELIAELEKLPASA